MIWTSVINYSEDTMDSAEFVERWDKLSIRERDALVAEKIFGCTPRLDQGHTICCCPGAAHSDKLPGKKFHLRNYSQDNEYLGDIIEAMSVMGYVIDLNSEPQKSDPDGDDCTCDGIRTASGQKLAFSCRFARIGEEFSGGVATCYPLHAVILASLLELSAVQ